MFLSLEGIDNTGKSTLLEKLRVLLESRGLTVAVLNDPPQIDPWKNVKKTITANQQITGEARAFMFMSARIDGYLRVAKPALERGEVVISDRFTDSWYAYQMTNGRFGSRIGAYNFLAAINLSLMRSRLTREPDHTFLILSDPNKTSKRGKNKRSSVYDDPALQKKIQENYLWLAGRSRGRMEIIESESRSLEEVFLELKRRALRIIH